MKRFILPGLAAVAAVTGAIAYAQVEGGPGHGHPMLFEMLDANKDGTVTRAEVTAAAEKHFAEVDTDHNGVISDAERDAMRARMEDEHFKRIDTDNSGQISREEFRAAHDKMRAAMGGSDGASRGPHRGGMGMGGMGMMQGNVTKVAFVTQAQAMFDRVDTDHDGKITAAERDAARSKMRGMRGHGRHEHPEG